MGTTGDKPKSAGSKSFFDVLFVGLFCFDNDQREAVMPDGRVPDDPTIQPHEPFLVVDPKDVTARSGWPDDDPLLVEGIYTFSNCTIDLTKATTPGVLNATQHDLTCPRLYDLDNSFQLAAGGASIITKIKIGQGTLEFLRRPDRSSEEQGIGTVSRLRVPHEGDVIVTVAVQGEPEPRVLTLKPGGDVAIVNAFLERDPKKSGNPLPLFGKITTSGHYTPNRSLVEPDVDVISANYRVFKIKLPIISSGPGCCPPP